MPDIELAVFEDNKLRRDLLQILLQSTEGFCCTGAYEDCRDIIKKISGNLPDVILMDINMPNVDGIEGLKLVRSRYPAIKILMQTIFEDEDKIFDSIINGADGYLLKKEQPAKLLDAIKEVLGGGAPMTPVIARQVLNLAANKNKKTPVKDFNLTQRELQILALLVQGLSYKMIAAECNISFATVNSHINHIYEKLHVNTAVEAVTKAIGQKIV